MNSIHEQKTMDQESRDGQRKGLDEQEAIPMLTME